MIDTPTTGATPDLDAARDIKVIPVARAVLNDMALELVPENAAEKIDYNSLLLKMLQRALDADLNLTSDNPYLFQLVLKLMSGLNATVQTCATVPIDDVRYGNIGRKILAILATANLTLPTTTPEQDLEEFAPVKEQISALFLEEKLTMIEVKYIMDNLFDSFGAVQNLFMMKMSEVSDQAAAKLFGLNDMTDLSMKKVDEVLKKPLE